MPSKVRRPTTKELELLERLDAPGRTLQVEKSPRADAAIISDPANQNAHSVTMGTANSVIAKRWVRKSYQVDDWTAAYVVSDEGRRLRQEGKTCGR